MAHLCDRGVFGLPPGAIIILDDAQQREFQLGFLSYRVAFQFSQGRTVVIKAERVNENVEPCYWEAPLVWKFSSPDDIAQDLQAFADIHQLGLDEEVVTVPMLARRPFHFRLALPGDMAVEDVTVEDLKARMDFPEMPHAVLGAEGEVIGEGTLGRFRTWWKFCCREISAMRGYPMEEVDSLEELLESFQYQGNPSWHLVKIGEQIFERLRALNSKGLIYNDLKEANLFFRRRPGLSAEEVMEMAKSSEWLSVDADVRVVLGDVGTISRGETGPGHARPSFFSGGTFGCTSLRSFASFFYRDVENLIDEWLFIGDSAERSSLSWAPGHGLGRPHYSDARKRNDVERGLSTYPNLRALMNLLNEAVGAGCCYRDELVSLGLLLLNQILLHSLYNHHPNHDLHTILLLDEPPLDRMSNLHGQSRAVTTEEGIESWAKRMVEAFHGVQQEYEAMVVERKWEGVVGDLDWARPLIPLVKALLGNAVLSRSGDVDVVETFAEVYDALNLWEEEESSSGDGDGDNEEQIEEKSGGIDPAPSMASPIRRPKHPSEGPAAYPSPRYEPPSPSFPRDSSSSLASSADSSLSGTDAAESSTSSSQLEGSWREIVIGNEYEPGTTSRSSIGSALATVREEEDGWVGTGIGMGGGKRGVRIGDWPVRPPASIIHHQYGPPTSSSGGSRMSREENDEAMAMPRAISAARRASLVNLSATTSRPFRFPDLPEIPLISKLPNHVIDIFNSLPLDIITESQTFRGAYWLPYGILWNERQSSWQILVPARVRGDRAVDLCLIHRSCSAGFHGLRNRIEERHLARGDVQAAKCRGISALNLSDGTRLEVVEWGRIDRLSKRWVNT